MDSKPNYTLRRIIAMTLLALAPLLPVKMVMNMFMPSYTCQEARHIVVPGETLWAIADRYCDGTIGDAVYDLSEVYGTTIYPNQIIIIKGGN